MSSLLLAACSTRQSFAPEPFTISKFKKLEKGAVLFSISEGSACLGFNIVKVDSPKILIHTIEPARPFWGFVTSNYAKEHLLFLEPGIYYIDYIQRPTKIVGTLIQYSYYPTPGIEDNLIFYGAFEVKAGKVFNLGKLDVPSFTLINDTQKITSDLKKSEYSYLLSQLEPGKFYEKGSMLYKDKDKKYKVINARAVKC